MSYVSHEAYDNWNRLLKIIVGDQFTELDKTYPTQVSWNGCRRLEDGNMEIEVAIDSVRHVPPYPVKFTMNKIDAQARLL